MRNHVISALAVCGLLALTLTPTPGFAWGDEGHMIIAKIALVRLSSSQDSTDSVAALRAVNALLKSDHDKLTASDFVSRATWADKYRDSDRNTQEKTRYKATRRWHFADIEIDGADFSKACPADPSVPQRQASARQPDDCVVNKINQFVAELRDAATPAAERKLALKFLLHFVGDLHQPLHSSDHHDAGGNQLPVYYKRRTTPDNLHSYWDKDLVAKLGTDANKVGAALNRDITAQQEHDWAAGTPKDWALDAFAKSRSVAYDFSGEHQDTHDHGGTAVYLDDTYGVRALPIVKEQLSKAGVRLAETLKAAFRPAAQ